MYPGRYFNLFPAFPREPKVFVAMSFSPKFTQRWADVIQPAIGRVAIDSVPLQALRVDQRSISDSILTEILSGIGRCQLVFADITSMGELDGRRIRNEKVL